MKILEIYKSVVLAGFATILAAGCATSDKQLDEKLKAEPPVKNRADLQNQAGGMVKDSNLSADQKARLGQLQKETQAKLDLVQEESLKLRSLLIKDMLTSPFNSDEVDAIKSRMRKVEDHRLAIFFDTVDRANEIIGRVDFRRKDVFFFQLMNQYPPRSDD